MKNKKEFYEINKVVKVANSKYNVNQNYSYAETYYEIFH